MAGASLGPIYNRLSGAPQYHPMSAETYADWSMEAGDIVTVKRDGVGYQAPVHTSTLRWHGKQQISINSEADRERPALSKMSQKKFSSARSGGGGYYGQQQLFYDMESEDGLFHATISATAESLRIDYTNKIGEVDTALSHSIEATASSLTSIINDNYNSLSSRIEQNTNSISMNVGRLQYSRTRSYASISKFPKVGDITVLYHDQTTGKYYIWDPQTNGYQRATVDQTTGEATYIKTGEIAIAFNESTGKTEAKLDADVVYVGRGATTLKDLDLPDWMDATEGLVATKATIVDLNALKARVGTLEANAITTTKLAASISSLTSVTMRNATVTGNLYIQNGSGQSTNVNSGYNSSSLTLSGNTYTLTLSKFNGRSDKWTFSRATSLSGKWSGGVYTVTASPQGTTHKVTLKSLNKSSGSYDSDYKGYTQRITVYATENGGTNGVSTGFSKDVWIDTSAAWNAGKNSVPSYSNSATVRYDHTETLASGSSRYWYYTTNEYIVTSGTKAVHW